MKKRILSMALVLFMVLSLVPLTPIAEAATTNATTSEKDITLGYSALHDGDTTKGKWDYVYFGTYNDNPIKWRVLSTKGSSTTTGDGTVDIAYYAIKGGGVYTGDALFMLTENTLFLTPFEETNNNNTWKTSNLRSKLQNDIFASKSKELKYVLQTTKKDSEETITYSFSMKFGGCYLYYETLFPLSAREVEQYLGSGKKNANRESVNYDLWWLRSPDVYRSNSVSLVSHTEFAYAYVNSDNIGVRPAMNFDLSSVLFTSAAVGGKASDATRGELTENRNHTGITNPDGYKLTLYDKSRSRFKATLKSLSGSTAKVSYDDATEGTNEYISAIIKNGNDVKYYGRVAAVTSESGEVDIILPSDFSRENGDVLCVFNEQYNGDKNTDYASKLIDVLFDYTVNFEANGGRGTMASQTMTYGIASPLSKNTFTRTGYTFNGWHPDAYLNLSRYSDGESVMNLVSNASTPSATLYAKWKINDYNISYVLDDGMTTNPTAYTVGSEDITLNNPVKAGYTFTGWSGTGLTGEDNMTVIIPKGSTGNRNYTAHYSVKSNYTVSFNVNGGDALADKTGVKWTDKILDVVSMPKRTGYTFKGWKHNDTDITANTEYKELVAGDDTVKDITLTAQWEENSKYTVFFDSAGGTAVKTKTNVKWTTDKVLDGISEPTRNGYEFTGWKCENVTVTTDTTYEELVLSDTAMSVTLTAMWKDITAPTGEITLGTNRWKEFFNDITFGLFFKDTQEVTITATDNSGEDVTTEYLLSDKELSETELEAATFTAYTGKFNIEPNNEYVIYAKLTDKSGNVAYLSSDGIVLDNILPVVSGIEDGKTYCAAQTVTVSDKNEVTVTVNDAPVTPDTNGQFTLSPAEGVQKIVVTDKAGNQTEMTVTVNDGHTGGTATCKKQAECEACGVEYGEVNADNHATLRHMEAKEATIEAQGNIEYWHCEDCNKYFSDKDGKNEIRLSDTVIAKLVKTDSERKSPKTGEDSHMARWFVLAVLISASFAFAGVYDKKKKHFVK